MTKRKRTTIVKKRILAAALAATLSVTMLSGCGKTESASNTNPSETAEEAVEEEAVEEDALREVNVVLDWYPNAIHAFFTRLSKEDILKRKDWMYRSVFLPMQAMPCL